MTDERELIEGTPIKIGRREYVVPALNLKGVRRVQKLLPILEQPSHPEFFDSALEMLVLAISRNYPDITREQLEEDVDLNSLDRLITATLGAFGFVPKAKGETLEATPGP